MSERSSGSDQRTEPEESSGRRHQASQDKKSHGSAQDGTDLEPDHEDRSNVNNRPRRRRPKPKKDGSNQYSQRSDAQAPVTPAPIILLNPNLLSRSGGIPAPSAANSESSESSSTIHATKPASPAPISSSQSPNIPSTARQTTPKPVSAMPVSSTAAESLPTSNERPQHSSVKLINEQLQLNADGLFKLLSEDATADFVVVGVIGRQSVGKSTLLNALAGHTSVKPINSTNDGSRKKPPFKVATANTMLLAQHQTHGVDAYITAERHILLDCEPIDSASVLTRMLRLETPLPPDVKSHEAMAHLVGLRLCTWLMSVCNIILVVDDGLGVTNLFKHFEAVQLLRWMLPQDASDLIPPSLLSNTVGQSYSSQYIALVKKELEKFKNLSPDDLKRVRDFVLREAKSQAAAAMPASGQATPKGQQSTVPVTIASQPASVAVGSPTFDPLMPLFLQEKISSPEMIVVINKQSPLVSSTDDFHTATASFLRRTLWLLPPFQSAAASPIGLIVLPVFAEDGSESDELRMPLGQSWNTAMQNFRFDLLSRKGRQFRKGFSEKEWLKSAVRMWDIVKSTPVMSDYLSALKATLVSDRSSDGTS